jgi:hypothetical protein
MNKISPKTLSLSLAAAICILSTQSAEAASLAPGSTLQLTGGVQIFDPSTLLFFTQNATGGSLAAAPVGSYGNYSIQTFITDGSFASLPTSNPAEYQIASINQFTPINTPFIKIGPVASIGNVDFEINNASVVWTYTPSSIAGYFNLSVEGNGVFRIDGTNANVGVGSFSSQFINISTLPTNRTYSGTLVTLEVVPEPSEVMGLLAVSAGGALTLLRRRRPAHR